MIVIVNVGCDFGIEFLAIRDLESIYVSNHNLSFAGIAVRSGEPRISRSLEADSGTLGLHSIDCCTTTPANSLQIPTGVLGLWIYCLYRLNKPVKPPAEKLKCRSLVRAYPTRRCGEIGTPPTKNAGSAAGNNRAAGCSCNIYIPPPASPLPQFLIHNHVDHNRHPRNHGRYHPGRGKCPDLNLCALRPCPTPHHNTANTNRRLPARKLRVPPHHFLPAPRASGLNHSANPRTFHLWLPSGLPHLPHLPPSKPYAVNPESPTHRRNNRRVLRRCRNVLESCTHQRVTGVGDGGCFCPSGLLPRRC